MKHQCGVQQEERARMGVQQTTNNNGKHNTKQHQQHQEHLHHLDWPSFLRAVCHDAESPRRGERAHRESESKEENVCAEFEGEKRPRKNGERPSHSVLCTARTGSGGDPKQAQAHRATCSGANDVFSESRSKRLQDALQATARPTHTLDPNRGWP